MNNQEMPTGKSMLVKTYKMIVFIPKICPIMLRVSLKKSLCANKNKFRFNVSETWSDKIVRFNDAMRVSEK